MTRHAHTPYCKKQLRAHGKCVCDAFVTRQTRLNEAHRAMVGRFRARRRAEQ